MSYLTMPEIAEKLRDLADVVKMGAGRVLVVLYVDEARDAHHIWALEAGFEDRAAFELEQLRGVVSGAHEPWPSIGEFGS